MPFLFFLSIIACIDSWLNTSEVIIGPLSLPTVEHALSISSKQLFHVPKANNTLEKWQQNNCSNSKNHSVDFPYEQMTPLVITLDIDSLDVNETTVETNDFTQVSSDRIPIVLQGLKIAMEEIRGRDLHFLFQCPKIKKQSPFTVLLAIDARVSTQWVYSLMYTLGQSGFASFAFLVHDSSPSSVPNTNIVGGIDSSQPWESEQILDSKDNFELYETIVSIEGTDLHWRDATGIEQIASMTDLPRFLGYPTPPLATLTVHNELSFQSLMQGYNTLYKSGTYCIQLSSFMEDEPKNSHLPISTLRSDSFVPDTWNQTNKRLSVIMIDLPMIGGSPKVHKRADGVRCAINTYKAVDIIPYSPESVDSETLERLFGKENIVSPDHPVFQTK